MILNRFFVLVLIMSLVVAAIPQLSDSVGGQIPSKENSSNENSRNERSSEEDFSPENSSNETFSEENLSAELTSEEEELNQQRYSEHYCPNNPENCSEMVGFCNQMVSPLTDEEWDAYGNSFDACLQEYGVEFEGEGYDEQFDEIMLCVDKGLGRVCSNGTVNLQYWIEFIDSRTDNAVDLQNYVINNTGLGYKTLNEIEVFIEAVRVAAEDCYDPDRYEYDDCLTRVCREAL